MPNAITVRCTVDNCHFWAQENYCTAESILVTSDAAGDRFPEGIDAPQTSLIVQDIGETPANSTMDTACKTFKHRR